jgi:hypothetical protein
MSGETYSRSRNAVARVPTRANLKLAWPPSWLADDAKPTPPGPAAPCAETEQAGETELDRPAPPPIPMLDPAVPPGARLFFENEKSRPCLPAEAHLWCVEGGPTWFYTAEKPLPPHEPVVGPRYSKHCGQCVRHALRIVPQVFKSGKMHLRVECALCGRFVEFVKSSGDNLDLQWRAGA